MPTLAQQKKDLEERLKIAYEANDSLYKTISELKKQLSQGIESSPVYQQALKDAEAARNDCEIWKDLYEGVSEKYEQLKVEHQKERERIDHLSEMHGEISSENTAVVGERNTERYIKIPNAPKRGAKRKADAETRQYIHELRKCKNSLQAIADLTGMSKTQVHTILKEPEYQGQWYSMENGQRVYYADYPAAANSGKEIHFEIIAND